jgi:hypothetical protein
MCCRPQKGRQFPPLRRFDDLGLIIPKYNPFPHSKLVKLDQIGVGKTPDPRLEVRRCSSSRSGRQRWKPDPGSSS